MFLLPTLIELAKRIRNRHDWPSYLLVACWAGFYVGFFSLARTKLPSYVLPAYPALALMTAVCIDHWISSPQSIRRWMRYAILGGITSVGLAFAVGFPIAAAFVLPGEGAIGLVGVPLLVGGGAALYLFRRNRPQFAVIAVAVAAVGFVVGLFGFAAVRASRYQNSAPLIALIRQVDPGPVHLATFDYNAPSLVFYAQQRVNQFYAEHEVQRFFETSNNAYLITRAELLDDLKAALPADVQEIVRQPRFLRHGKELVVFGRAERLARLKPIARSPGRRPAEPLSNHRVVQHA